MRGEPPPPTLKVSLNSIGGFRNSATFVLTGLDIDAKAALLRRQLDAALNVKPAEVQWDAGPHRPPRCRYREAASALLSCAVRDPDPANVGRQFSSAAVELALASYPGFTLTAPPGDGRSTGCSPPATSTPTEVAHVAVHADGTRVEIPCATDTLELAAGRCAATARTAARGARPGGCRWAGSPARAAETRAAAANIGVWVRTDEQWRWLAHTLTVELLKSCCPRRPNCRSPGTCCPTCAR